MNVRRAGLCFTVGTSTTEARQSTALNVQASIKKEKKLQSEIQEFKYIKSLLAKLIGQYDNAHRNVIVELIEDQLDEFSCLNNCPNCQKERV